MSITVRLPSTMTVLAEGKTELTVEGTTVEEALAHLDSTHPGFRTRLLDPNGELRQFINIYVNKEDIRAREGLVSVLSDGDEISIVPALAGG